MGGQDCGRRLLAARHGLIHYAYDYHDARAHADRARAHPERYPHHHALLAAVERDPDAVWVRPTPPEMAASARANFTERFAMVLTDVAALSPVASVVAEGCWGLRPEPVAPLLDSPRRAIFLVPSQAFRQHQLGALPRADRLTLPGLSDPERAQRNRVEREQLLAEEVVATAQRLGLRVVVVGGSRAIPDLVGVVEEWFRPFLPRWLY